MNRLANNAALVGLQNFLGYHLGEQHHASIDVAAAAGCTESARIGFLPLVFGLMPVHAAFRQSPYIEIKPIINSHLMAIGVAPAPLLIGIVKDLCDNFDRTRFRDGPPSLRPRKSSIADLRAQPELYRRIRGRQGSRCAVCGTEFSGGPKEETLDHVIPWRLGGDPPGGWNWQLLCRRCNCAKDTLVAAHATPEFVNWIFPDPIGQRTSLGSELHERGRYVALRHFERCQMNGCSRAPKDAELQVVRKCVTGFPVFDHLTVSCVEHGDALGSMFE
jgi:hypothetical protein